MEVARLDQEERALCLEVQDAEDPGTPSGTSTPVNPQDPVSVAQGPDPSVQGKIETLSECSRRLQSPGPSPGRSSRGSQDEDDGDSVMYPSQFRDSDL